MSAHDWRAVIFDETITTDRAALDELRANPTITFVDERATQRAGLAASLPGPEQSILEESDRWVYFPWRAAVTAILGPRAFRTLRSDRNRNKITVAEQHCLGDLTIGVIGLSVGHAIAHTLALEGICGTLRLADFDDIELSNLNRIPASILDLGVNKAVVAARRIAEIDPYLEVQIHTDGLTEANMDEFFRGLDILVEECDSLDVKIRAREAARERRIPVLMETSDRGLLDVERFDLEPERPVFHGVLGDIDSSALVGLAARDKIPFALRQLDPALLSARMAASMIEMGETIETWPQLGSDVQLGGATIAAAVRRLGTGRPLPSGRIRIDLDEHLDELKTPTVGSRPMGESDPTRPEASDRDGQILAAAQRAPSGGNTQPWTLALTKTEDHRRMLRIEVDPSRTSTLDVEHRGSCVAVGAAAHNAVAAARAQGRFDSLEIDHAGARVVWRERGDRASTAEHEWLTAVLARSTNRNVGAVTEIDLDTHAALDTAATEHGARVILLTDRYRIASLAAILGSSDRIRFLTGSLHADLFGELRWPGDAQPDTGIEVGLLGIDESDLAKLDIVRRSDVMALVTEWNAGDALRIDMRERVLGSSALAVVVVPGRTPEHYIRGGIAMESVWVTAQLRGLAVQPVSPAFLYAHTDDEYRSLSAQFAETLRQLNIEFRDLFGIGPEEAPALVLRLTHSPITSARSRRLPVSTSESG